MVERESQAQEVGAGPEAAQGQARENASGPQRGRGRMDFRELLAKAEAGAPDAAYLVGIAYARGKGVAQDDAKAVEWFKRAAASGHTRAQVSLGYCFASGRGVTRDLERAYILLKEAADAGDREGFELAERVAQRLHVEQLRRCDELIRRRRILRKMRQKERASVRSAPEAGEPAFEIEVAPE